MSRSPREILLNTAQVLREQAEAIHDCGDSEGLREAVAAVRRALDELESSPLTV